ncbi:MAG: protein kinase domain-containing protein [Gammaproteobacteria bacterium]
MSSEESGRSINQATAQAGTDELRSWLQAEGNNDEALLGSGYQGSAYYFDGSAGPSVVKMPNAGGLLGTFQGRMIRREYSIYQRLQGIAGVPQCYGLIDGKYLVLEFVEGAHLKEQLYEMRDNEAFYAELLEVLHRCHAVGIAHGDLKRRDNVIVTSDNQPCVIDFGTAVVSASRKGLLFKLVRRLDYNSWIKLKYRADTEAISDADLQWYQPLLLEKMARGLRRFYRAVTFRQQRKARRRAREADDTQQR